MSPPLDKTNQSNHDYNNDSEPEVNNFNDVVDDDDTDDDEDRYADPDRMLFLKSLVPVGNSFALVRKSNGDPTFIMYEGLSDNDDCGDEEDCGDDEDCVDDSERRTSKRTFTGNIQGSNCLSPYVSPSRNQNSSDTENVLNCLSPNVSPTRNHNAGVTENVSNFLSPNVSPSRNHNPNVIENVSSPSRNPISSVIESVLNSLFPDVSPSRNENPSVMANVSSCLSPNVSLRRTQNSSFMENVSHCLSPNVSRTRTQSPGFVKKDGGDDHSGRGLLSGSADRESSDGDSGRGYDFWLKNAIVEENSTTLSDNGKICDLEDGIDEISSKSEAEGLDGWVLAEMGKNDLGNGADREKSSMEARGKQDYHDSKRGYDVLLGNSLVQEDPKILSYNGKRHYLEIGNGETSLDSEVEVVEKAPDCNVWKYTPIADSNVDALMQDDDLQYLGERSKPENPQFRKDVEDFLGRPYDEKEYLTLWLQVSSRKPIQGYRELRGRLKRYETDTMGKSYLDEYSDLRRKLDTFETDLPRKLNVLRGFFYYLKIPKGSPYHAATSGEMPFFKENSLILKKAGVKVDDPVHQEFNGQVEVMKYGLILHGSRSGGLHLLR